MAVILTLILWIIISIFSILRVTQLLHEEDGPWDFLRRIRDALGVIEFDELSIEEQNNIILYLGLTDDDDLPLYDVRTFFGKLFDCFGCLSLWVSFPHVITLFFVIGFPIVFIPILTFGIGAIVVEIHEK